MPVSPVWADRLQDYQKGGIGIHHKRKNRHHQVSNRQHPQGDHQAGEPNHPNDLQRLGVHRVCRQRRHANHRWGLNQCQGCKVIPSRQASRTSESREHHPERGQHSRPQAASQRNAEPRQQTSQARATETRRESPKMVSAYNLPYRLFMLRGSDYLRYFFVPKKKEIKSVF